MSVEAALLSLGRHVAIKVAQDTGKRIATALPRARGEWRGALTCKAEGLGWRVENGEANPCRLFIPEAGLEYAFGNDFWSDGGSIPKPVQGAKHLRLKPDSFPRAYFLHDWLYEHAKANVREPDGKWTQVAVTRLEADTLLYCGLVAEGATALEARVIFRAVRVFGEKAWKNCRKKDGTLPAATPKRKPRALKRRK